ncbi:MAG: methyl-accepting chemotaxis protein [Pseudomonadota bacterium]
MAEKFKRRNYFIDKGAQGRFMAAFAAASMAGGIVAVFCFRYFAQKKIDATIYSMKLPDVPISSLLMGDLLISSLFTAFFVIVLFVFAASRLFSRINGPLKKMSASVQGISSGDLQSEVKLRENDEFQEFAEEVNGMVQAMHSKLSAIRHHNESIGEFCRSDGKAGGGAEYVRKHIEAIKQEMQVLKL